MIPRRPIYRLALRTIAIVASFAIAAFLLADVIGLFVEYAPGIGTFFVGLLSGVLLVGLLVDHDHRKRTKALEVNLPVAVLTRRRRAEWMHERWVNKRGHVRYGAGE